jgi:spermidine synthase
MALYREVIQGVRRVMVPGAIVTTHGEGVDPPLHLALRVYALLAEQFRYVELHRQAITTFAGDWGFILASNEVDFRQVPTATLKARAQQLSGPLKSLILDRFPVAFQWPLYLTEALHRIQETRAYIPEGETAGAVWLYPNSESGE